MNKRLIAIFAATLMLATGCASVPMADTSADTTAKTFKVAPNKSGIYIYRNESMGAAVSMDLFINGKPLGQTAAKTYAYVEVDPGKHKILSKAENEELLELDTLAGKLYYVWQEVKMGLLYARNKLSLVDEKTGQAGVMESKLISQKQSVVSQRFSIRRLG